MRRCFTANSCPLDHRTTASEISIRCSFGNVSESVFPRRMGRAPVSASRYKKDSTRCRGRGRGPRGGDETVHRETTIVRYGEGRRASQEATVGYFLRRNIDTSTASHARPRPPMMVMSHCCHVTRVNSNSTALIQLMAASQGAYSRRGTDQTARQREEARVPLLWERGRACHEAEREYPELHRHSELIHRTGWIRASGRLQGMPSWTFRHE